MKAALSLILILASLSSFAQSRNNRNDRNDRNDSVDGQIIMRDGKTTVRINVGNDDRDMNLRMRRLEQAVRDLQAQVYDLQDTQVQTRIQTTHVCSLKTPFNGTLVGKSSSRVEADAEARNKCVRAGALSCSSLPVTCEVIQEEIVLR